MVAREVPFFKDYTLLYNWKNLNQFFAAYGIRSLNGLDKFWKDNAGNLDFFKDYPKILMFGLNRKDKKVSIEEAAEIMGEYLDEGHDIMELTTLIINAQVSGLVNPEAVGNQKKGTGNKT